MNDCCYGCNGPVLELGDFYCPECSDALDSCDYQ